MGNYFENAKTIQEKRSILKQLSEPIKVLVKMGQIECINEGLKTVYAQSGHCELKTLRVRKFVKVSTPFVYGDSPSNGRRKLMKRIRKRMTL